jgi:hypothetical protein
MSIGTIAIGKIADKAHLCHGGGTEVIGVMERCPRESGEITSRWPVATASEVSAEQALRWLALPALQSQCTSKPSGPAPRPGGGTTTVDRLPSAVSF